MKTQFNKIFAVATFLIATTMFLATPAVRAEGVSIAVLDMQKVVLSSKMGKKAQGEMEKKVKELEKTFKKEEDALSALKDEIEKKSSVWSEEKKRDKSIEFQKLQRDLRVKQDDANLELKQMQEKQLAPIFKELETVVKTFAKEKGYAIILPGQAVLYAIDSVDISDEVTKALDAKAE